MNRILYPLIAILLVIVAVIQLRASNDGKAPVAATAAGAAARASVVAEGRVSAYPGGEVVVGTDVAGRIDRLLVQEQQRVAKGDLIAIVNADETRAALDEAHARIGELEADIRLYQAESARAKGLFDAEVGSRQNWDKARRDLEAARARRVSALANAARLEALLAKTRIESPIDGVVIARHTDRGETVIEGDEIVTVANLDRLRVEAEVDEFDAARVRPGATVNVAAEGYGESWRGTVEEIPSSVVSRRINPPDPSKPIDTRVLLVKIAFAEPAPLKLGQRVEVQFE